jgi:hypothetical protein
MQGPAEVLRDRGARLIDHERVNDHNVEVQFRLLAKGVRSGLGLDDGVAADFESATRHGSRRRVWVN